MLKLSVVCLASAIFTFCESVSILEKVNKKCSIHDDECLQGLYGSLLQEISTNGIPELDVPKIDPLVIKDREIVALGMVKITIKEGEAKGFKNCHCTSFKSDVPNQRLAIDYVCDHFTFEGSYKIESTPSLLALSGGIDVHGEGNGVIDIEKIQFTFDFAFETKKLDDGEIHILLKPDDSSYDFDVQGKATIQADNIFIGKQEISAVVVNIFNENWKFITKSFGKTVVDTAMAFFFKHSLVFFNKTPAKEWITDDLSSYVKS